VSDVSVSYVFDIFAPKPIQSFVYETTELSYKTIRSVSRAM